MSDNRSYTEAQRNAAVAAYVTLGSFPKAAAVTGISESCIRLWAKEEWFQEAARRVGQEETDGIKATFTRIAQAASAGLEDRLEKGDEVVLKDGTIVNKKVAAKELAIIAGVAVDKRNTLMDKGTGGTIQNAEDRLMLLMKEFVAFTKKTKEDDAVK